MKTKNKHRKQSTDGRPEVLNEWRDTPWSWIEGLNTVKMSVLLKIIHRLKGISIKTQLGLIFFFW